MFLGHLELSIDLLIQQFAADLVYCVALGGAAKLIDRDTDALLRRTKKHLFCPDFDVAGKQAWLKWQGAYPNSTCILTPKGKGAGDAYLEG